MKNILETQTYPVRGKGMYDITKEINSWVSKNQLNKGHLNLFIQHTSASLTIMENASPPEVYHLTNRDVYSIRQIVEIILEEMGEDFDNHVEISNERPGKDMAYTLKPDKIEQELGWSAKISLRDGIKETIAWVKQHFDFLKNEHLSYRHKP